MLREPKVAVYMSCYNHEKYVAAAVDSILNQTYPNLELYVVNDGSTDRTGDILAQYSDERMHYFDFKENTKFIGAAIFLLNLIKEQDVDYVASMASDDLWEIDKLEKQINFLKGHPEYKACFTWDKIIFDVEESAYRGHEQYSHKKNKSRFEHLCCFFDDGNFINMNSMLIEKDIFYEIGGVNENYLQIGDWRAWMLLAEKYPFYLMEEELTYYRRHETNLSNPASETTIRIYNEAYRLYREVVIPMEKDLFHRTFYKNLVYVHSDSPEEFLAEKFITLIYGNENRLYGAFLFQVAIDLYFANCDNQEFLSVLENKYCFNSRDFIDLTGGAGFAFGITRVLLEKEEKLQRKWTHYPAVIFLNFLDEGKITQDNISEFRYTVLRELYVATNTYEGGGAQFERLKREIEALRDRKNRGKEQKALFIIAETSAWDIQKGLEELNLNEKISCSAAYIPEKSFFFTRAGQAHDKKNVPEDVRQINLCNEKEHCLYFLDELSEEADIIYYVDCLDGRYECGDMLAGYSLGVEFRCILQKDLYEDIQVNHREQLSMMKEIIVYG